MPIEHRIRLLVEEALDSGRSPGEVCLDCPELLGEVRRQWERVRAVEAEMEALFPGPDVPPPDDAAFRDEETGLPRIEGYDVEAVIGRGGMGVVYRARHRTLNRTVALKMILAGAYASSSDRARFQREAEAVAALRHPNVVQVYDSGEAGGRPYFTMEFVEGGTLAEKLARAPLAARPAADLVAAIAGAVHAAHASGIVHRDLKPVNILLSADGTPKVSDFGLARYVEGGPELTLSGARVGTPSYMAPEQALGRTRAIGPATDVYALGAILYELLTGRPPFKGESAAETERQVIANDPVPPSQLNVRVPRDLETICLKCLHKEPHRRYANAAELKADLDGFLAGEAISARPERWLERQVRGARRRPVLTTLFAAGAVLCVTASLAYAWYFAERAAADRERESERAFSVRTASEHLDSAAEAMGRGAWPEARESLLRAEAALGRRSAADTRARAERVRVDLELVDALSSVRLKAHTIVAGVMSAAQADAEYNRLFQDAGLGGPGDLPDVVAARVRASNVRSALVAALDYWWWACAKDSGRREWLLAVSRLVDGDAAGWRARARAPGIWNDEAALFQLVQTTPLPVERNVPLLLIVEAAANTPHDRRVAYLKRVHELRPLDFWVNVRLAEVLQRAGRAAESIEYYQTALSIGPGEAVLHNNLGLALQRAGRQAEAAEQYQRALALARTSPEVHLNLAVGLWNTGRYADAEALLPDALRLNPKSATLHTLHGKFLASQGRDAEALDEHRLAVKVEPRRTDIQQELRACLMSQGKWEEARVAWEKALAENPDEHDAWYGYAEFSLFLGKEDEYLRARGALLAKFGAATDPFVAERVSRAVLLRPASGDELRGAAALAERAAGTDRSRYQSVYHAFAFVRGLVAYRQGRLADAITAMTGDASRALGPVPQLVVAMAQHRSGRTAEARRTLAAAVLTHDWRPGAIRDQDGWIIHAIRREAEAAILPDLPAFLDGKYQPRDNDERLALLGVCQSTNRSLALARLYADAFATDPTVAGDFRSGLRFSAARAATLVGCGRGEDVAGVEESERARWRQQARQWLRADLAAWSAALEGGSREYRELAKKRLASWQTDPDLSGLRDAKRLADLTEPERADCLALWERVAVSLKRAAATD
jgi:serine/threonine-protein kinase